MNLEKINKQGISCILNLDKYGLSIFSLKIVAIITMFIDHFAFLFVTENEQLYNILRSVGRLSFPIFCFVLVEGYFHTTNRLSYAIRLGTFSLISEIPYNMMYGNIFFLQKQNVMFTLFIGFMVIWGLNLIADYRINYSKKILRHIGAGRLNIILELIVILVGFGFAHILNSSYAENGVLLIMCFYVFKQHHIGRLISNVVFNMGMYTFGVQWWGILSTIPISLYNGKPGDRKGKYFFYWFYPVHILMLVTLKIFLIKLNR